MKIRTRLAIRFTLIVASLLAVFALAIYFFSASYHKKEFYARLNEKAVNYCKLVASVDRHSPGMVKLFDKNTAYLPLERIRVYDKTNRLLFDTNEEIITGDATFLNKVRREKALEFSEDGNEVLAKLCIIQGLSYVAVVSARDIDSLNKLDNLKLVLLVGFIICVLVTMLAGWIFAGKALKPISGVVSQVESITALRLTDRVNAGNENDEIGQLAFTFNRMLERIQKSFELQKSFVSNSSHELRTPLTSITGQLEVALMNKREPEEYKEVLSSVLEDIRSVNRLTNGLLELAQAEMDYSKFTINTVRLDELLWSTRADVLKRNALSKVNIEMRGFPDEEKKLIVMGSEHLLRSAFVNIMDNACKFSKRNQVDISLEIHEGALRVTFTDDGIGISEQDLQKITQPFFRGLNARSFPGHGLGLSLTAKIIELHGGEMKILSKINKGTSVVLRFYSA